MKPDGSTVNEVMQDRGNEALAYSGMHDKISDALELLVAYSALLDRMEDKRFTKAEKIKNELFTGGNVRLIIHNILRSPEVPWDRKLELAESVFDNSSEFILSALDQDSKHQNDVVKPIRTARSKLIEIVNEIRHNRELIQSKELMERRQSQVNSIIMFKALKGRFNVMCNLCVRSNSNESLLSAIHGVRHEDDCKFKNDQGRPIGELLNADIQDHYQIKPPMDQTVQQEAERRHKKRGAKPKY